MISELKLPELGENIDSGNVVKVLVSVGQNIAEDQPVLELETDKATIEVPSSVAGVVKEIHVSEGGKASVGQVVLSVETDSHAKTEEEPKKEEPVKEEPLQKTKVETKAEVKEEPSPAEEETENRVITPRKKAVPIEEAKEEPPSVFEASPVALPTPSRIAPASPSVRRLAREIGVEITDVGGTGPGGRITSEDVKKYARQMNRERRISGRAPAGPLPDFAKWGEVERKAMNNIRLKTAEHMSIAWSNIPQVTQFDKADITDLDEHRKQFGKKAEAAGGKLTITAILIKVVASALKNFPQFNASLDMTKSEIVYKKYYHIGVAVDTDRGLLVPVVRSADRKNILQLSVELNELAEKARNKKLSLEEMQGGSFTITNLGGIGGTNFSPIVNYPEVAILGISRGSKEPIYTDGQFEPRLMLPLSLSYDHRLIDGADAARFLRWVCEALQDPFLVALEG